MSEALDLLAPARVLRKAELTFRRRLDGTGPGSHRSIRLGEGVELADIREYTPGDDVRTIDWNVTARTGHPHVRVYDADREATALVVVDRSASMAFGTAAQTKEALVRDLVAAVAVLVLRRGDRIGGLAFADEPITGLRPAGGKKAALRLVQLVHDTTPKERTHSRLDLALEEAGRIARRRSIVVVASDWLDAGAWEQPLRRLTLRHEVIAAEIRDPREGELPNVGPIVLEDPETGRQLEIDTSRTATRDAFASAVEKQRAERAAALIGAGASHLVVSTDRDWLADLLRFVQQRKKMRR
jgi:uncharacterized protein (DUF58 family)